MAGRRSVSTRGRLFGSDTVFEVLSAARKRGTRSFTAADLVGEIDATHAAIAKELAKLESLRVLQPAPRSGDSRERPYRRRNSRLARQVLALPALIERDLLDV
jgi:hypothetical protein